MVRILAQQGLRNLLIILQILFLTVFTAKSYSPKVSIEAFLAALSTQVQPLCIGEGNIKYRYKSITYMHKYIHICIHMYIFECLCTTFIYIYKHCLHIQTCIYVCICIHTSVLMIEYVVYFYPQFTQGIRGFYIYRLPGRLSV